jgi:hypothetical protein
VNLDPERIHDAEQPVHFPPKLTGISEPELTGEEIAIIQEAERQFEEMCKNRYLAGRAKYGNMTFLEMPTLEMAMEEIVDLANYARFTFVKVALLRQGIKTLQDRSLGQVDGFFPTDQILGAKKEI